MFVSSFIYSSKYLPKTVRYYRIVSGLEQVQSTICLSYKATESGCTSAETAKPEAPCHSRCGTIKIPHSHGPLAPSKTINVNIQQITKFCSSLLNLVTSPYERNIFQSDVKYMIHAVSIHQSEQCQCLEIRLNNILNIYTRIESYW